MINVARLIFFYSLLSALPISGAHGAQGNPASGGIESFNNALIDATQRMDTVGLAALWDEDGIALLPDTSPMVGKRAIEEYLSRVAMQLKDARMQRFELVCSDVLMAGAWASEWCREHQIVDLGTGKAPFEGWGNLLLVLHRGTAGRWRIIREMWNQGAHDP